MPKPEGKPVREIEGLKIYVIKKEARTGRGKDRIWISVRQDRPKKWRVAASLCYVNGVDIRFEK